MNELKNPVITAKVKKSIQENYRVRTIVIDHEMNALPGQFLMVWMPGIGERPMSIGDNKPLTISVAGVGKVTKEICKLRDGDMISFRGPLGKPFMISSPKPGTGPGETTSVSLVQRTQRRSLGNGKPILCIGGGYGIVPMHLLAKRAKERKIEAIAIIGAQRGKDIIWKNQLSKVCKQVLVTTDDGSEGTKGTVMAEAQYLIENKKVSAVYACGPEKMMEAVAQLCSKHKTPCQLSLERYMKCGMGVCGSCAVDGKLCCVDGPVFTGEEALAFSEFGKKRDATGQVQK